MPLRKKDRVDGLSNRERDLDDDEFETPPEIATRVAPVEEMHRSIDPSSDWAAELMRAAVRKRAEWRMLEGPYEKVNREQFFQRLEFPDIQVTMCPRLVFSNTLEPVPCTTYKHGLNLSCALRKNDGQFHQGKMSGADLIPASCKVHVPLIHSSVAHAGRLFKIRIELKSIDGRCSYLYSKPFEVVSKLTVVNNARKRKASAQNGKKKKRAEGRKV